MKEKKKGRFMVNESNEYLSGEKPPKGKRLFVKAKGAPMLKFIQWRIVDEDENLPHDETEIRT